MIALPIILVLIGSFIGAIAGLKLKQGANNLKFNFWALLKNKNIFYGLTLYVASSILLIIALKFGELSVIFPITSTTYIWVAILSTKYLNEEMTKQKWLGIIAITIGVIFIGLGS